MWGLPAERGPPGRHILPHKCSAVHYKFTTNKLTVLRISVTMATPMKKSDSLLIILILLPVPYYDNEFALVSMATAARTHLGKRPSGHPRMIVGFFLYTINVRITVAHSM